jgi:hypothetical protein
MRMTRHLFVLLLLFLKVNYAAAQQEKVVMRFIDSVTTMPVEKVVLLDKNGTEFSTANKEGYAAISYGRFSAGYIVAIRDGYKPDTIYAPAETIYLRPLFGTLNPAVIYGNKVHTVLGLSNEYVADYSFAGNNILVAAYNGSNGRNAKLFLLNKEGDVLHMHSMPNQPLSLFKSCVGNHYCVCDKVFYPVSTDSNIIKLKDPYDIRLLAGLQQCEQSIDGNLYYRIGDKWNFRMDYGMISKNDSLFKPIINFEEPDVADASFQEYMEILFLLEHGNIKEASRKYALRKKWDRGSYAHISIPLFTASDTLIVFDYFKKSIRYYKSNGEPVGVCNIKFEWRQSQHFEIIKDEALNKFYIHRYGNQSSQTLEELDIHTGTAGARILIDKPLAEQVKVNSGSVYFLWQDSRSDATRRLFAQRL